MSTRNVTRSAPGRKAAARDSLTELERRAIGHSAWLRRAATFDGGRPTLTISSEFALELSSALCELVQHVSRTAA